MTDVQTQADTLNALFAAKHIPLTARAGKTAVKFFKHYEQGNGAGYSIPAAKARNIIRAYTFA